MAEDNFNASAALGRMRAQLLLSEHSKENLYLMGHTKYVRVLFFFSQEIFRESRYATAI